MAFFKGDEEGVGSHDAMAKEIAAEGKQWTEDHWCVLLSRIGIYVVFCTDCSCLSLPQAYGGYGGAPSFSPSPSFPAQLTHILASCRSTCTVSSSSTTASSTETTTTSTRWTCEVESGKSRRKGEGRCRRHRRFVFLVVRVSSLEGF
jgi:hypothetical protein